MLTNALLPTIVQMIMSVLPTASGSTTKRMTNTFYYRKSAGPGGFSKSSLATQFEAVVGSVYIAAANADITDPRVKIRSMCDRTDPHVDFAMTGPGAIAGQRLPMDTTVVMLLTTAKRLPRYKSRKFFTGASEADTTGDVLSGAGLGRWEALRDALVLPLTDSLGNTWIPCTLQGAVEGTKLKVNPTKLYTEDVTGCVLNKNVSDLNVRHVKRAI